MVHCLDGLKHLFSTVIKCWDIELSKQPRSLEDPEALARETVCMLLLLCFPSYDVWMLIWKHLTTHCYISLLHYDMT